MIAEPDTSVLSGDHHHRPHSVLSLLPPLPPPREVGNRALWPLLKATFDETGAPLPEWFAAEEPSGSKRGGGGGDATAAARAGSSSSKKGGKGPPPPERRKKPKNRANTGTGGPPSKNKGKAGEFPRKQRDSKRAV